MHQLKFTSATILTQDTGSTRLFAAGLSSHSELPIYRIVKRKTNLNCSSMDDSFGPTPCKPLVGSARSRRGNGMNVLILCSILMNSTIYIQSQ